MPGPALRQIDGHQAIHAAAWERLAEWIETFSRAGDSEAQRRLVLRRFVQDFEAHVLRHAEEEEQDLYPEWERQGDAALREAVRELVEEHRRLAAGTALLRELPKPVVPAAGAMLEALLKELRAHQEHEEAVLLAVMAQRRLSPGSR